MSIARIAGQDVKGTGITPYTRSYPNTPTQGNLLIACGYTNKAVNTVSVASGGNAWTQAFARNTAAGTAGCFLYYRVAGASESKDVVCTIGTGGYPYLHIYEYQGFLGTPTLDKTISANSASTTNSQSTGTTATIAHAVELIFASVGIAGTGNSPSFSNSFNLLQTDIRCHDADYLSSSAAAFETTDTWTGTAAQAAAGIATFWDNYTPPAAVTMSSAATLTGAMASSATLTNTAPPAVTMTAAATLTGVLSSSATLSGALPATVITTDMVITQDGPYSRWLYSALTLTGAMASEASVTNTPPATTLSAAATLTGALASSASLTNTPPAVTMTAASTLTGSLSASASVSNLFFITVTTAAELTGAVSSAADLTNTPPAAVSMTAAGTLTGALSSSAEIRWTFAVVISSHAVLTSHVFSHAHIPDNWKPTYRSHWPKEKVADWETRARPWSLRWPR